jgi:D-3-phosphoglycerate dehydrogenase
MAVRELMDYVRNGNITNSVNYPACSLGELRSAVRIAICHRNVPKMISHFTNILADNNIAHMNNSSRGDYAYTLLDLDTVPGAEALRALEKVDDVLRVRVIDPNGMM